MKQEATDYYHSLLNDQVAAETQGLLDSLLQERRLFFGGKGLCTVLRPNFYSTQQFQYLRRQTEIVLGAFEKTHRACMANSKLREQFSLAPWEEEMMQIHPGNQTPWSTSRLDSFYSMDHDTLQFIEYNAETPAGMAYEDVLAQAFLELPVMKRFQEKYSVLPIAVRGHLLDALLETYEQWLGRKPENPPSIAIADWDDVPTKNEHILCKEWFEAHGCPSLVVDPRQLEYRDGKLRAGDFVVNLIYKRVLGAELFQQMGANNPIFQALRDRAVCISNSFQALLLYKKCSLSFISDEANHHLFTPAENAAIAQHVPWTRTVADRKTYYKGNTMDLLRLIADNRERLVLKPNDSYGGKGVVLGWESTSEEWSKAIEEALREPYVVQEKVNIASEYFPSYTNGYLRKNRLFVDADPFIFMGRSVHGVLTRLSSAALLNVTAGHGSTIPSFIVTRK